MGRGINLWVLNFQVYSELLQLKSFLSHRSLDLSYPFSWNFNFHRNLFDFKIEDLKRLMSSLTCLLLSPSTPNARAWSLSSSGLFIVKFFFVIVQSF